MVVGLDESTFTIKSSLSISKHLVTGSLATAGRSDKHEAVTNDSRIVKLEDFVDEGFGGHHELLPAGLLNATEQHTSVNYGLLSRREQIDDDVLEQRQIILQELRHVDISERT